MEAAGCLLLGSANICHLCLNIHLPPSRQMGRRRGLAGRHDTCLCWPASAVCCSLLGERSPRPTGPPALVWLLLWPASESAWGCYRWSTSGKKRERGDICKQMLLESRVRRWHTREEITATIMSPLCLWGERPWKTTEGFLSLHCYYDGIILVLKLRKITKNVYLA